MDKPLWLLDVDGVLNATRPGWGGPPTTRSISALGNRWRMRFAPQAVAAIHALTDRGLVDVAWATSWVGFTDDLARVFGLDFPPAFPPPPGYPHKDAIAPLKLAAALDVLDAGRRLIWTDDDAIPVDGSDRARMDGAGALLLAPKAGRGLRPADLAAIGAFLGTSVPA